MAHPRATRSIAMPDDSMEFKRETVEAFRETILDHLTVNTAEYVIGGSRLILVDPETLWSVVSQAAVTFAIQVHKDNQDE